MPMDEDVAAVTEVQHGRIKYVDINPYRVQKIILDMMEAALINSRDLPYYDLLDHWFLCTKYPSRLALKPNDAKGLYVFCKRGNDGSMAPEI